MRIFRMTYKSKSGRIKESRKWAIEFRDHREVLRRLAGFTDKAQTEELGRKVETLVAVRANGERPDIRLQRWLESMPPRIRGKLAELDLLDGVAVNAAKPLIDHLEDFRTSLHSKGRTVSHVELVCSRAKRVIQDCKFMNWSDISSTRIEEYLAIRRREEARFGAQTSNFYIQAVKQFCRWMVANGRAGSSPVEYLDRLNVRVDRRHDRRALSLEEMRWLLFCTSKAEVRHGRSREAEPPWSMTGPERAMLYRLAMETGLRSSELRSLKKRSFALDAEVQTVTVEAAYSKRRRRDALPLREETVAMLLRFLAPMSEDDRVFKMPKKEKVAELLLCPDLEAARSAWVNEASDREDRTRREASDFLKYVDSEGRYADFHSLRHSFITNVARTGAHFKTSQDLARHSTPVLTARYTHSVAEDQVWAVRALPDLSYEVVQSDGNDSASCSSEPGAEESISVHVCADDGDSASPTKRCKSKRPLTLPDGSARLRRRRGAGAAERAGFENRSAPSLNTATTSGNDDSKKSSASGSSFSAEEVRLGRVVHAWPRLSPELQRAIVAMVESADGR